jgi:serine/threonine protein kinase
VAVREREQNSKSDVWLCHSAAASGHEQREVVLKLVETRERMREEARVLRQLRGVPNVAQLLDVIEHYPLNGASRAGLVMEYYPSGNAPSSPLSSLFL